MDMPEKANNLEEAPQGTTEVQAGTDEAELTEKQPVEESYENTSLDELRKMIEESRSESAKKKEQEPESEETPDDLRDKSREELIKILVNLRKLKGRQDQELGELRKFKQQMEELQKRATDLHLSSTAEQLVQSEVAGLSEEERERFYEAFAEDPVSAIQPIIQKALRPLLIQQAKQQTDMVIRELKEKTKDSLVPYNEEEINKIIHSFTRDGKNELFDKHGLKAYEVAYDIYYKSELPKALERKIAEEREKAKKEVMEELSRKGIAFTEPPGLSGAPEAVSIDYEKMSARELEELIRKMKH